MVVFTCGSANMAIDFLDTSRIVSVGVGVFWMVLMLYLGWSLVVLQRAYRDRDAGRR